MQEERPGLRRAFVALQHRAFRLLFLSTVVSGIGGQLQQIANLWQVFDLTGSAIHLGLTGLARAVPIILFSLIGGVVADRVDRKRIIIFTQSTNGVLAVVLGLLSATGLIQVWHIYAVVFLNATLMSLSQPARRAIIAGVVPRHHLVNAMALNASVHQFDRIVAPAFAGTLIAVFGLSLTYAINGAAQFITAVMLVLISLPPLPARAAGSPVRNLVEGLAFVRVRKIILVLLATDAAAMLFGSYQVLLPIVADHFDMGPAGFGFLSSGPAIGAFVGTAIVMYLGDFPYKGRLIFASILAYCGFLVGLALAPTFAIAFVLAIGLGLSDELQASPRNAMIQLVTPDALRGRVSSFQQMVVAGMPALGLGLMGVVAATVGAPIALIGGAILCAAVNVGIFAGRKDLRARDIGAEPEPAAAGRGSPLAAG